MRNEIAMRILRHWGYHFVKVGDIDPVELSRKETRYKTQQAVAHAFRLADIAIETFMKELVK